MDEERKRSIREALQTYRQHEQHRNLKHVRTAIDNAATMQPRTGRSESEETTQSRRVQYVAETCYGHHPLSCWDATMWPVAPEDFLADGIRERYITRCGLDGVCDYEPVDMSKREAWFTKIRSAIAALHLEAGMPRPQSLPADLEYLCTLVDGICGPGLPDFRFVQQVRFIDPTSEVAEEPEDTTRERVLKGIRYTEDSDHANNISMSWQSWQISLGVCTGECEVRGWAGTYILYCRRLKPVEDLEQYDSGEESDSRDEWKDGDGEWQWRYGTFDEHWESKLYNNVEDFLAWYVDCKSPGESQSSHVARRTNPALGREHVPAQHHLHVAAPVGRNG